MKCCPVAEALTQEDWDAIDAAFASNNDPVVGVPASRAFREFFRHLTGSCRRRMAWTRGGRPPPLNAKSAAARGAGPALRYESLPPTTAYAALR